MCNLVINVRIVFKKYTSVTSPLKTFYLANLTSVTTTPTGPARHPPPGSGRGVPWPMRPCQQQGQRRGLRARVPRPRMLHPDPQCHTPRGRGLREAIGSRGRSPHKWIGAPSPSACGHRGKTPSVNQDGVLSRHRVCGCPDLGRPASRTVRGKATESVILTAA